ncbi:Isotrichodermin C-15 hydroxylase [Podospora aff. communis PSN243]|uniref:Isotrichodermin C-15 hydroxylase n=1 Tax=Podospora aff. communis PSN243 TaxID=3040156 RepID=A0AAV9GRU7_9PEZI|nr:Isotrichodermin C-15 hydroxylase [Podospora aff. communis PSN243]
MGSIIWTTIQGLSWPQTGLIVALSLLTTSAAWVVYNVFFHPLAGFPGPVLYGASSIPMIYQQLRGNITIKTHELHEKYGDVVRIAPWELSYISAAAWKDISTGRNGKDPLPLNPIYGLHELDLFGAFSMLWQQNEDEHARHRRIMAPAFSDRALREQEPVFAKYASLLMQRMRDNAGTPVDLCAWFHFVTFDIIGDLTFGEPFRCLEQSRFHPWIRFILTRLRMMLYGQIITAMGPLSHIIKRLVPKRIHDELAHHAAFTRDKVDRRREKQKQSQKPRQDFMVHILGAGIHDDNPPPASPTAITQGLTLPELYADAQVLVMAGSETSATLLSVACFNLLTHPRILSALQSEIRPAFASEDEIAFSAVARLPYLGAVINESLRWQPPIPAGIHRLVPAGGAVIDGRYVPEGADVVLSQWAANRSRWNFKDAHAFVPERWLGEKKYEADQKETFQPFGMGVRNCIGRSLALMEARMILARLVWGFDMEMVEGYEGWAEQKTFILYEKGELRASLTPVERA